MDDFFNPYYTFLGLDEELVSPDFYQLLRLREREGDPGKINAAADKAATRVRGHRPGEQVVAWSRLLDQIQAARVCLLDPLERAAYDHQLSLQSPAGASPATRSENPAPLAAPAMTFIPPPQPTFAYPPGAAPQPAHGAGYGQQPYYPGPAPYSNHAPPSTAYLPNPAAQGYPHGGYGYSPAMPGHAWNPAQPAADPMAPMPMPGVPGPMSPVGYSWSTTPPAGPTLAPPIAPVNPNTFDPMAPVAFPMRSEPPAQAPEATPRIIGFAGAVSFPNSMDQSIPFAAPATASPVGAVPVGETAGTASVATIGLPTKPASARPQAKRPPKFPLALGLVIGGGAFLLVVLIVAWSMSGGNRPREKEIATNSHPEHVEEPVTPHPIVPQPMPEPRPRPVRPQPPVIPEPEKPAPEMTRPMPKPEPEPEKPTIPEPTKPEPVKPEPKPEPPARPTPSELAELSRLMKEAKTARGDFTFDEAEAALDKAERLAKLPEHKAVVHRLKSVADMAKKFRRGIEETMAKLEAGEVIKVGTSTEAAVVEVSPEKLILRVAGQNKTYTLNDMPLGLAVNLGERSFSADDPKTRLLKGSYVFIDKRTDPTQLKKAKTWWEEAQLNGVDIREILPVLTDKYEFAADAPE